MIVLVPAMTPPLVGRAGTAHHLQKLQKTTGKPCYSNAMALRRRDNAL